MEDRIGKIAEDVSYIRAQVDALVKSETDHETRLRGLERFRNYATGVGTMLLALVGVLHS
jgi:hypothetical protein